MAIEIVAEYAAPGRGPAGLAWDGQQLWHADYREGLIYQLDTNAEVVRTLWCPGTLAGLTWDGRHLWQALLDEGTVRSIDPQSTDFDQTLDLTAHGLLSGVTWDGDHLYVVAQQTGSILSVNTLSGAVQLKLQGPVAVGDIDWSAGSIWLSAAMPMSYSAEDGFTWLSETRQFTIIQLDAQTGHEISRHQTEGLFTGLAWDSQGSLWLASATERKLYRAVVNND